MNNKAETQNHKLKRRHKYWRHRNAKNHKILLWTIIHQQIGPSRRNWLIQEYHEELDNQNKQITNSVIKSVIKKIITGLLGGPLVKNLLANVEDTGLMSALGRSHMSWNN